MPSLVLLVGLVVEVYLLLNDLPLLHRPVTAGGAPGVAIGELVSFQNIVKVQGEGELVWEDTHGGQTLYRRQSLLTLDNAKAEVAFLDGTGLVVDEKSLILLEKAPSDDSRGLQRIVIRLLHGTLHKSSARGTSHLLKRVGEKTPEIEVRAGDAKITLSPQSELTVTSLPEDLQGARVVVQSGEVKLDSAQGSITVKQGEEASLPNSENRAPLAARQMPFTLLSPRAGQTLEALADSQPVRFRWNTTHEAASGQLQQVEVSRDPQFKSGVISTRVTAAEPPLEHVEVNLEIPSRGTPVLWHWRVRTSGPSGFSQTSPAENFWIRAQELPLLKYPHDHGHFAAGAPIEFAWSPMDSATGYELEIQGASPLKTAEPFGRIENLPTGPTQWKVRARLRSGDLSPWSVSRELVIAEPAVAPTPSTVPSPSATPSVSPSVSALPDSAPPPPEELGEPEIRPDPRHTWLDLRRLMDLLLPSANAAETGQDAETWTVHLKWRAVKGVKKYHIQVARERLFQNVVTQGDSAAPEWDWKYRLGMENSKGRAFFRVASINEAGKVGEYSKAKPINITQAIISPLSSGPAEVYAAKEGEEGPAVPTDAAVRGDLGDLSAVKVQVQNLREEHLGTSNTLKPAPIPPTTPPPVAESTAQVAAETPTETLLSFRAALDTGFGTMKQNSGDPNLNSVTPQSPYLQQKLSIAADLTRLHDGEDTQWMAELQATFLGFHAPDDPRKPLQSDFHALALKMDVLRTAVSAARSGPWRLSYGATLDRAYRWVKSGPQGVEAQGALSLGPSGRAVRTYHSSAWSFRELGGALDAPLTGILTSGQAGIQGWIWGEWNLAVLSQSSSIELRVEAESAYLRWSQPTSTSTLAWTFWVAPVFRF